MNHFGTMEKLDERNFCTKIWYHSKNLILSNNTLILGFEVRIQDYFILYFIHKHILSNIFLEARFEKKKKFKNQM